MFRYFLLAILSILMGCWGYFYGGFEEKRPYELDYKKMVINLPVAYAKELKNTKMGLGEKYLAEDMAFEIEKLGYKVAIYTKEDTYSNWNFKEGIELYMRKDPELELDTYHGFVDKDKVAVLFETVPYNDFVLRNADIVITGSNKKNEENLRKGINSYYLPQFTRLDEFYNDYDDNHKSELLFVGNRWGGQGIRKTIKYAIRNNIKIDVYGQGWEEFFVGDKKEWYKGQQIENDKLRYYYSSADIVLNDTREDMIEAGFISNRIFDASACGAFIISDYIKEIEEIYGDSIAMYKNEEEFVELVKYYLNNKDEREEKAKKAQEITIKRFGGQKVLGDMMKIIEDYIAKNKDVIN